LYVEIETNGSVELNQFRDISENLSFTVDYKLPGSGMERMMNLENYEDLRKEDTVKFVVSHRADLDKARQIQEGAKELYEKMNELNIENYDGAHCKVVLKRPYERRQINSTEFLKDFKPNSDMYKKYVEVKVIKGHVTLKKSEK
jgi:organic radical activating enzyme